MKKLSQIKWWSAFRTYRIGQNKNVMVYRLITQCTFEEKINAMLKEKKELAIMKLFYGFWLHLHF